MGAGRLTAKNRGFRLGQEAATYGEVTGLESKDLKDIAAAIQASPKVPHPLPIPSHPCRRDARHPACLWPLAPPRACA